MAEFNKDSFNQNNPKINNSLKKNQPVTNPDLDPLAASPGIGGVPMSTRSTREPQGMFVGPDDPLFTGGHVNPYSDTGIFGGPQQLAPGAVPHGARFDPIGPFGIVPGMPNRPHLNNPRGRNPLSGEPDNDELPPPNNFEPPFM